KRCRNLLLLSDAGYFFELASGSKHEVGYFTQYASPAFCIGHQVNLFLDVIKGVGGTNTHSCNAKNRYVVNIITNENNFLVLELVMVYKFLKRISLVKDTLVTEIKFQFSSTQIRNLGFSSGNSADNNACFFQVADDLAVFYVEILDFFSEGIVNDPTIGQHPVDIKKDGLNRGSLADLLFGVGR